MGHGLAGTLRAMDCPECGKKLKGTECGAPRYSPRAFALFGVAAGVTLLWGLFLLVKAPDFPRQRGAVGLILRAAVYLAPGLVIGGVASSLPKVRTFRCKGCRWTDTLLHKPGDRDIKP